jgi:hypothetical protein
MKAMIAGFSGWARMESGRNETVKVVDTGITVLGTLLVAVTYMLIHTLMHG